MTTGKVKSITSQAARLRQLSELIDQLDLLSLAGYQSHTPAERKAVEQWQDKAWSSLWTTVEAILQGPARKLPEAAILCTIVASELDHLWPTQTASRWTRTRSHGD